MFDKREEGFKNKFAHQQELRFEAMACRNKMLGLWAAGHLGKSGAQGEARAKQVVLAEFEQAGEIKVLQRLLMDLQGKAFTGTQIRTKMRDLLAQSFDQVWKSG